jgi:hypothetical protein
MDAVSGASKKANLLPAGHPKAESKGCESKAQTKEVFSFCKTPGSNQQLNIGIFLHTAGVHRLCR